MSANNGKNILLRPERVTDPLYWRHPLGSVIRYHAPSGMRVAQWVEVTWTLLTDLIVTYYVTMPPEGLNK